MSIKVEIPGIGDRYSSYRDKSLEVTTDPENDRWAILTILREDYDGSGNKHSCEDVKVEVNALRRALQAIDLYSTHDDPDWEKEK